MKQVSNKNKIRILYAILGLTVGVGLYFAAGLYMEMRTIGQGQAFYATLSVEVKPRQAAAAMRPAAQSIREVAAAEPQQLVDFDAMREMFPDIVGWIQSEGTVINYPIVLGDDNDFYLYRLADGTRNAMGSIFMDYRNLADFSDGNIVIYGHDMRSGDKFGSFRNYRDQQYFERHSTMFIFTPQRDFELVIFAGFLLDSAYEVPPMSFRDEADFDQYIADITRRSFFRSDVEVEYGDQLVFLATCTPTGSINERMIIVGKLAELQVWE